MVEKASVVGIARKLGSQIIETKEHLDKVNIGIAKDNLVESTVLINELEREILELLYFTDDLRKDLHHISQLLSSVYRAIDEENYNMMRNYKHNLRMAIETLKEHFTKIDTILKGD